MRFLKSVFLAGACLAASSASATVELSGTVTDPSGLPVPQATVVAEDLERGARVTEVTDARGSYRFLGMPIGRYAVTASAAGFRERRVEPVVLTIGEASRMDLQLALAGLSDAVEVEARVRPADPTLSGLVQGETVRTLPLDGRDLGRLVLLEPGVTWSRSSVQSNATGRGTRFSAGGAMPSRNLFVLDGTITNDPTNHTPGSAQGLMLGVDAVQEFRVLAGPVAAEYARAAGGGVFLAASRAGDNRLRGSLFGFGRDEALDAKNYFDVEKPEFSRRQFGATVGGPIERDRSFFFASYEGLRETKGLTLNSIVPDAAARAGIIDGRPVTVDPRSAELVALYPLPNGASLGGGAAEYRGIFDRRSEADLATLRVDRHWGGGDAAFVRYVFERSFQDSPRNFPEFPNQATNRKHVLTGEGRKTLGPGTLATLRLGWSRSRPSDEVVMPTSGPSFITGQPTGELTVTGLTNIGTDQQGPTIFAQDDVQLSLDLTASRGRHLWKAGFLVQRLDLDGLWASRTRGQLRFRSLTDLLAFRVLDLQGASGDSDFEREIRQWVGGLYVQDEFHPTRRLRLDLGVRVEGAGAPEEASGKAANLRDVMDPEVTVGNPLFDPPGPAIAPRGGLVWDATGDGRTLVRAAAGLYHELPLFYIYRSPAFRSLPYSNRGVVRTVTSLPVPASAFAGVERTTDSIEAEMDASYMAQWLLGVHRDLSPSMAASLTYMGSRGQGLFSVADVNTALPTTLADGTTFYPAGSPLRNTGFGVVRLAGQGGDEGFHSRYHALVATLERRAVEGVGFKLSYQLGDSRDNVAGFGTFTWANGQHRSFDPYNPDLDLGRSNFDVRHTLTATVSLRPSWRHEGFARVIDDWALDVAAYYYSGVGFTPTIAGDPDRDGSDQNPARPNLVPGVSTEPAGGRTPEQWFNPAAFVGPTPGFRGNAGRNILTGPDYRSLDLSLSRRFSLSERVKAELRIEAYNVTNRANFDLPANSANGQIVLNYTPGVGGAAGTYTVPAGVARIFRTVGPGREMQLGLRLTF